MHVHAVRRALLVLVFIGCARGVAPAITADPSNDPLVVGRSPEKSAPDDDATDASAVVTWGMPAARDAAVVRTGCYVDAKGHSGALTMDFACFVEQEPDPHVSDSGRPFLGIWPTSMDSDMRIVFLRKAVPSLGVQPSNSFTALARIGVWSASTINGSATGKFTLTLTSVRAVRDSGLGAYELHGAVDAQLVPDWNSSAVGWIDLHAEF